MVVKISNGCVVQTFVWVVEFSIDERIKCGCADVDSDTSAVVGGCPEGGIDGVFSRSLFLLCCCCACEDDWIGRWRYRWRIVGGPFSREEYGWIL